MTRPVTRREMLALLVAGGALVAGGDVATPDAVAAVSCPLGDGATVRYVLFASGTAVDTAWQDRIAAVASGSGRCEAGTPFVGRWRQPGGLFGLGTPRTGRIACWLARDGTARLDWTVDGVPVLATLHRPDEDVAAAYDAWSNDELSPRSAG